MLHSLTDECTLYSTHSLAYMSVYRVHSPMSMHTCTTINRHAHVSLKERLGHKLWRKGRVEGFFPIAGHAVGQSNACTLIKRGCQASWRLYTVRKDARNLVDFTVRKDARNLGGYTVRKDARNLGGLLHCVYCSVR